MVDINEKLNEILCQSKDDFKFVMIALDNVTKDLGNVTNELGTVKAKMARQEERFEMMLQAVQQELTQRAEAWSNHEARLQAIEKKIQAA